jgi:hypothetical protein
MVVRLHAHRGVRLVGAQRGPEHLDRTRLQDPAQRQGLSACSIQWHPRTLTTRRIAQAVTRFFTLPRHRAHGAAAPAAAARSLPAAARAASNATAFADCIFFPRAPRGLYAHRRCWSLRDRDSAGADGAYEPWQQVPGVAALAGAHRSWRAGGTWTPVAFPPYVGT